MEGFNAAQYNEILIRRFKLKCFSYQNSIGYRHVEDETQHLKKVRKTKKDLLSNHNSKFNNN
jgi:hypothetical protein